MHTINLAESPADARPRRLGYSPALDGVRAVAVLAVLAYHGGVLPGGYLGVDLFLVLSGFLITSLLVEEVARSGRVDLTAFWVRRAARLMPAAAALLLVASLAVTLHAPTRGRGDVLLNAAATAAGVDNWWRVHDQQGGGIWLGHVWSLSVEQQFYLFWPLLLALLIGRWGLAHRRRIATAVALTATAVAVHRLVLIGAGASAMRIYFGTDARADALLVGCALGLGLHGARLTGRSRTPRSVAAVGAWVALVLAALWSPTLEQEPWYLFRGGFLVVAVAAALIVGQAITDPGAGPARVLEARPLVGLGKISYGFYLWHYPVLAVVRGAAATRLPLWVITLVAGVATAGVAQLSWQWLERPGARLIQARWAACRHRGEPVAG
ncbi:MAG: acyltransferase [Kineosporiaceae bacterium]|nr:acyltransferase [Kineosporiaceae bacterium]